MSQHKLRKFAENKTFPHFFEPELYYDKVSDFKLKSKWNAEFFKNDNPIIVELGCGRGEYSFGMAKELPDKNFIGVDIKGARMWRGATDSLEMNLKNIAFVRTRVEFTPLCFADDEISEIWITFPDPQLGAKKLIKKRLTSSRFLTYYQNFLKDNGIVNLKTDDDTLYNYTRDLVKYNNLEIVTDAPDLYNSEFYKGFLTIKTYYEKMWNEENRVIKYISFRLPKNKEIIELPVED